MDETGRKTNGLSYCQQPKAPSLYPPILGRARRAGALSEGLLVRVGEDALQGAGAEVVKVAEDAKCGATYRMLYECKVKHLAFGTLPGPHGFSI